MKDIYWVGARSSDIIGETLFSGSITRFGDDTNGNYAFCNNNFTQNYNDFIYVTLHEILKKKKNSYFMFSNEISAYQYGKEVYDHSICTNDLAVVESLNDKIFVRKFFDKVAKIPSSIILNSSICSNFSFINCIFNKEYSEFVLQASKSAGGNSTYFISENDIPDIKSPVPYLLVTPYLNNALSINLHIIISAVEFRILPPSIQITIDKFKYSGSDFIAYEYLDIKTKKKIINCAQEIAQKMQTLGCKGIFGVDLLLHENDLYFIECNYRYQGSSFLLNLGLLDNELPSIFRCRYDAFHGDLNNIPKDIYNTPIKYSSFRRTNWNQSTKLPLPYEIIASNNSCFASSDGYQQYEIYKCSIIELIEKQEVLNLYLSDLLL